MSASVGARDTPFAPSDLIERKREQEFVNNQRVSRILQRTWNSSDAVRAVASVPGKTRHERRRAFSAVLLR